jgi:hypothetical protein
MSVKDPLSTDLAIALHLLVFKPERVMEAILETF